MFERLFRKPQKRSRVLPDYSTRELIDTKERIGSELHAALYYFERNKFLVSAISAIVESGEPIILGADVSDDILGLAVCDKLLAYTKSGSKDLRGHTASKDWATYRLSGAKSIKYFERESTYVSIRTLNSALQIEASPRLSTVPELKALCSISNGWSHDEIGKAVRRAINASEVLRNTGEL